MMSSVFSNPVPAFEFGFTPCDESDLFSIFDSPFPGLEITNPCQTQNQSYYSLPGLKDKPLNRTGLNVVHPDKDERRKRRKKSNRESARRSRMKKQKHVEEVRSRVNQLKIENRELQNRFRYVMHHCQRACIENDRLRLEHHILHEKLLNLRQALVLRQIQQSSTCSTWSCVNSTVVTVQQNPSMTRYHVI